MPSIVDKSSVKTVCVDDFALRKRFSYGTVMVDLGSHRIIDLIPSRETADVRKWLATFPHIQVVSRDGASTYSSATTNAHPDAIQISDRFHLIKGLSEAINKYIVREFPARVEIPAAEAISEEMKALYNTSNRTLRIRFAHQKRKEGLTVADIALLLHSCPTTVRKYLVIPEDITTITANQYEQTLKKYPLLSELYSLVKNFYSVIFSKKPEKIDTWIESAHKYDIPELQTFVEGLLKDLQAIKNGIAYPYNNGLAEGSVNKIKVIKRIMYGRSSFDLLKAKVLFHELFHVEIN